MNIMIYNNRIYETLEWGSWANKEYGHAAMVMSCDVNDDLLIPENWSFTEPLTFDYFVPALPELKKPVMTIEGTLTLSPGGELLNIMRIIIMTPTIRPFTESRISVIYNLLCIRSDKAVPRGTALSLSGAPIIQARLKC